MSSSIEGKIALITGGSTGTGFVTAVNFLIDGGMLAS